MTIEDKVLEVAKFCEIDVHKLSFLKDPNYVRVILGKEEDFDWDSITDFDPHRDWNWLMKAWEKFRDIEVEGTEHKYPIVGFGETHFEYVSRNITEGSITEAFEALYEGIDWYNNLSNPSHH